MDKREILSGNYALAWLSDKFCPDFQDIGIGIGCLKIIGNTQFSIPLCPGVQVLSIEKDPTRSQWRPHAASKVEPLVVASDSLEFSRLQRKQTVRIE